MSSAIAALQKNVDSRYFGMQNTAIDVALHKKHLTPY